ncbi:MFS transporter [Nocardia gipuzkoensis]|uniref:MFS transporter n=1 Tax=Nocardia gipuzkoensis TaxID=2749991 RepID=UPI001E5F7F8A|nr:MFS transporter [Nocardia gipuzkoensis]UGT66500.1 MFS transporter [Nocardia gipuzkoensis]
MSPIAPLLRRARIANSFAFGLQGFFFAVVLTELPQQKERFGLSDEVIVVSVVFVSLLAGAGSVVAERLALRRSSRDAVRIGLLLVAVTGSAAAFAPNAALLVATLGCYGIAVGIVDASTNMQAVFIQRGYGTFILSSFYAAWSAGSITGALFVSGCEALGVTLRVSLLAAAAIVFVLGSALGPHLLGVRDAETSHAETGATSESTATEGTTEPDATKTTRATAEPGVTRANTETTATATRATAEGGAPKATHVTADPGATVALRAYLAFGVAMALVFAVDLAVGNWSALYLTDDLLATSATAALALAAYQGTSLLARLAGDSLVRRFGPRRVVRVAASTGALGLAIVVAAPSPVIAIAGFLVAGVGLPVIAPLCFSAAGQLATGRRLDALIARLNLFNYAGTLLGGGVIGAVAASFGHRMGFVLASVFAVLLIALARVFRSHRVASAPARLAPGR